MFRTLLIIVIIFLNLGLIRYDESTATSPSPKGDTRMGANVAGLGKDLSEDVIQAQEEAVGDEGRDEKNYPTNPDIEKIDVK